MWPFSGKQSSKQKPSKIPAEVQDYYQAERRERAGIAWLLGIATLIVVILLAIVLFFGGRWLYRKATNKNKLANPPTAAVEAPANKSNTGSQSATNNSSSNSNASSPSSSSNTPSTPSSSSSNSTSNSTNSDSTQSAQNQATSTPSTSSSAPLPRTGPDPNDPN